MKLTQDNTIKILIVFIGGLGSLLFFLFQHYYVNDNACFKYEQEIKENRIELDGLMVLQKRDSSNVALLAKIELLKAMELDLEKKYREKCLD